LAGGVIIGCKKIRLGIGRRRVGNMLYSVNDAGREARNRGARTQTQIAVNDSGASIGYRRGAQYGEAVGGTKTYRGRGSSGYPG
jgi:hypothetical protein